MLDIKTSPGSSVFFARCFLFLLPFAAIAPLLSQDARELHEEKLASKKLKGEHPLVELMRTRKSALKPELMGLHPLVYVTESELKYVLERGHKTHRPIWQQ